MLKRDETVKMYLQVDPEETDILIDYVDKIWNLFPSWMKKRGEL